MVKYLKLLVLIMLAMTISWFYLEGGREYLRFEYLKSELEHIQNLYKGRPQTVTLVFGCIIILLTSLSIPGSIILTVLAGAIFGVLKGSILVTLATTIGAGIAFLMARFLFKDYIAHKFHRRLKTINRKTEEEGARYLLTLRLIPASPFIVINLLMGLTPMGLLTFTLVTFVGMFPGTFIYVFAGREFGELENLSGIMSPSIIACLFALSLLPYIVKKLASIMNKSQKTKELIMDQKHEHRNKYYTIDGVEFEGEDLAPFKGENHLSIRSDDSILEEALELLARESKIDDNEIEVTVQDGRLFLRGKVQSPDMRELTQEGLEGIRGVKEVINQLDIQKLRVVKDLKTELSDDLLRDEELKNHKMGQ